MSRSASHTTGLGTALTYMSLGATLYWFISSRMSGGLSAANIPPMRPWNGKLNTYNANVVREAVSRGAETFAVVYAQKRGTPEGNWWNTLTPSQRLSAYYQGYIIPYLHGYYGGPGVSIGECCNVPWQLRHDNARGAREGIEGEG